MSSIGDTAATFCATLVDEWIRQGVKHAVVAPGSRSTPLAIALTDRDEINIHLFHDERSASFAALGIGLSNGVPAVLLCTSGTAAAHFHAAVVEAHQSNVPIIVVTADRPPELRDVGAPQTIDQTQLFGSAVRWFHDPGVASDDAKDTWRSLAARAYALTVNTRPGPVHLNLPFRDPLVGTAQELPVARDSAWSRMVAMSGIDDAVIRGLAKEIDGQNGVIVAGRGTTREVLTLAHALGWPVLADPRSGVRECDECVVIAFDGIIRAEKFLSNHRPSVVLRCGEPPASKVLSQWTQSLDAFTIQMSAVPVVIDPSHVVGLTLVGDVSLICNALANHVSKSDDKWANDWRRAESAAQGAITKWTEQNFSEPTAARTVTRALSAGDHFVISSSMPIRDVEWFGEVTSGVSVYSNRGANGIDGVVSTAVGVALASGAPTYLLIGDVACLHDVNGLLALSRREVNLTIVVTNNDGGSIFSFLPQASVVSKSNFELLYGTPHGVSFENVAKTYDLKYQRAASVESLEKALSDDGTRIIEVLFDRGVNVAQHDELQEVIVQSVNATV